MQFSTKCWSEHILSAYKATKDLKYPLYMTFKYGAMKATKRTKRYKCKGRRIIRERKKRGGEGKKGRKSVHASIFLL